MSKKTKRAKDIADLEASVTALKAAVVGLKCEVASHKSVSVQAHMDVATWKIRADAALDCQIAIVRAMVSELKGT